jgi:hypothetical protein
MHLPVVIRGLGLGEGLRRAGVAGTRTRAAGYSPGDGVLDLDQPGAGRRYLRLPITAERKDVVIIGGDTGTDCLGTAYRQHGRSVAYLDIWRHK